MWHYHPLDAARPADIHEIEAKRFGPRIPELLIPRKFPCYNIEMCDPQVGRPITLVGHHHPVAVRITREPVRIVSRISIQR